MKNDQTQQNQPSQAKGVNQQQTPQHQQPQQMGQSRFPKVTGVPFRPQKYQQTVQMPVPPQTMGGTQEQPLSNQTPQLQMGAPSYQKMMQMQMIANQQQHAAQTAMIGPHTTITAQCQTHKDPKKPDQGLPIAFDSGKEQWCEKCIQELEEKQKNDEDKQTPEDSKEQQIQHLEPIEEVEPQTAYMREPLKSKDMQVQELQMKLQSLLNSLSQKIQKKAENLLLSHEELSLYERTLTDKYNPVYKQMSEITRDKRQDYMTFLTKQLNQNKDRVQLEKETFNKLTPSYTSITKILSKQMEEELANIKIKEAQQKKMLEKIQKQEQDSLQQKEETGTEPKPQDQEEEKEEGNEVDSYKIEATQTMLDDFDNIIGKNFCVYSNYEDFSFAQSRSKEKLDEQLQTFFQENFSGNFQVKNWFNPGVIPKVFFLQQGTKFIYTYKVLHQISECQLIQNAFVFPERGRSIVTPEGKLYCLGGYVALLKTFSRSNFILDEYRSQLVGMQMMKRGRADHALLYFRGNIFVFGGTAYTDQQNKRLQSLNTCEVYSVQKDSWIELPPFQHARQSFNVSIFNDKYIFIFGGKCLKQSAIIGQAQPFDFVSEVEVYDLERNTWKVINYISDKSKLRVLHPGNIQITGKKIMIFGGIIPFVEENEKDQAYDNGHKVAVTSQSLHLDVTSGNIKRGPDMIKPCYYLSGSSIFAQNQKINAFGFGVSKEINSFQSALGSGTEKGQPVLNELNPNLSRKVLHCYKVADNEWSEVHEGIFSGPRKRSFDTLDES